MNRGGVLLTLILLLFTIPGMSSSLCLNKKDVTDVSKAFPQFQVLIEDETLCLAEVEDNKKDLFHLTYALVTLKNLELEKTTHYRRDELSVNAIGRSDWWRYFAQRASSFEINPTRCKYSRGTIAYVYGDRRDGIIYLCPLFFTLDILEQVETLLHEVRHFDGFSHVTCNEGVYAHLGKNCDESIHEKGPYAVTIQALVSLSQLKNVSAAQKYLLESLVVGRTLNNFNKKVKVKTTDYAYLANKEGEVYRADVKGLRKLEWVTKLHTPSMVFSNGSNFTLIPLNRTIDATRMDRLFQHEIPSIGKYAQEYNKKSPLERELYSLFEYYEHSGFLKDGDFYNNCGIGNDQIDLHSISDLKFRSMVKMKVNKEQVMSLLIDTDGKAHEMSCYNGFLFKTTITPTTYIFPRDIQGGFSARPQRLIYLNEAGEILHYQLNKKRISPTGIQERDWVSITPHRVFQLLDQ